MHVVKLELENFRGVGKLEMEFDRHVTVLIGKNGAGKTTIIEAINELLGRIVDRINNNKWKTQFSTNDIRNGCQGASLAATLQKDIQTDDFRIVINFFASERGITVLIDDSILSNLFEKESDLKDPSEVGKLPLLAFYPVSRSEFTVNLVPSLEDQAVHPDIYESQGQANFRRFFEWYRIREDLENETRLSGPDKINHRDPQLEAVRRAFLQMLPNFTDLRVRRHPLRLELKKDNESLLIDQLSLGEKSLLAMIGDLARRLAIRNPELPNPLEGNGIILIDEIDLHLHPHWQRNIIRHLRTVFPNCQFIVSTHSPQIVGEVDPQCLRILSKDPEGNFTVTVPEVSRGLDSAEVLQVIMETPEREEEIDRSLRKIFDDIDHERFDSARSGITELKQTLHGSIPEIVRAETMIALLEP